MSDHWLKKMRTYFTRIDFDKDGAITRADFEGMAARFIEQGKLDAAKAKDLTETLTAVWDKYLSAVGGGSAIKKDAFIEGMKKLVGDKSLKACLEGPLPLFFHAVDTDHDEQISKGEFKEFYRILGLDTDMSDKSFDAIDTNHDGQLSMEEFTTAGSQFFMSEDKENPNNVFWGPLVD